MRKRIWLNRPSYADEILDAIQKDIEDNWKMGPITEGKEYKPTDKTLEEHLEEIKKPDPRKDREN